MKASVPKSRPALGTGSLNIDRIRVTSMGETIIGIDIGGTTVKIGFLNMQGDVIHKWEIDTNREKQGLYIVDEIWNSVTRKISEFQMTNSLGIGVGARGFVDKTTGLVYEAVNIGWKDFELG